MTVNPHDPRRRYTYDDFLRWRDIAIPCVECHGTGRSLALTTNAAGTVLELDPIICPICHGSGDRDRPWRPH